MPSARRRYAGWTHERILREAAAFAPDTAALIEVGHETRKGTSIPTAMHGSNTS
jgi:hypothetical protein